AQARAQFLGGRFGEGHGEDLAQRETTFDHQSRHQGGQGESLAGAGTGLDQLHAIEIDIEIGIGGGVALDVHAPSPSRPWTTASNTMPATARNSSPSASSANGSRPRSANRALGVPLSLQPRSA